MSETEDNKSYLVCLKIIEGLGPPVVSTRAKCSRCRAAVWRADSSPSPEEIEILCVDCMLAIAASEKTIEIIPPTKRQLESIRSALKRRNN